MLALLAAVVDDRQVRALIGRPDLGAERLADFLLDIGGGRISEEGQNLVRLLAQNGRVALLPEIARLYEVLRSEHGGAIDVELTAAYPVNDAQRQSLAAALGKRLGREVRLSASEDKSLIGGVKIRAGDLVIDGSVRARLEALASQLGT